MYCSECGSKLDEGTKFCGVCGTKVDEVFEESNSIISAKKKKKGIVIAVSTAVVLLILGTLIVSLTVFGGADRIRVERLCSLGDRYLSELEYEEAIVAYEAAIEIEPKTEKAYIGLADAYIGLDDYESALKALERGIRETDSERLEDYRDDVQEEWDDKERRICGTVFLVDTDLNDSNNDGIADFGVYLTDRSGKTTTFQTDENGYYDTGRLKKGTYSLRFFKEGYVEYQCEVDLKGGRYDFDVFLETDTEAVLYGSIHIADTDMDYSNNRPLADADVSLNKLTGSNPYSASVRSDSYGQYTMEGLHTGVYRLVISKAGYMTVEQNIVIYEGQDVSYNTIIELIDNEWSGFGTASGMVYDALTGAGVSGLTLSVREGINNTAGNALDIIETDDNGYYRTSDLPSGNYCIEIRDNRADVENRYIGSFINIKILGGMNIGQQDGTVSNSIQTGQVRIVLTWGENPYDLDSHLDCNLYSGDYYHIFYYDKTFNLHGEKIADLDLDDTDSFGPETTTIYVPEPGNYTFGVHNFSGGSEDVLANSGACVQVYMAYSTVPNYVFYVPGKLGYYWEVFQYNSATGVLTPINEMTNDFDLDESLWLN